MKKILLPVLALLVSIACISQELTPKEKAENMAKDVFSKSKHEKKEHNGVTKEKTRIVESTPVVKDDLAFYAGNYWYKDLDYKIEVRLKDSKSLMASLTTPGKAEVQLKNVMVKDAWFSATMQNEDGTEEKWEGVFINKSDDGNTEFGLGIKPATPFSLTEGLKITRFFFKKVSQ